MSDEPQMPPWWPLDVTQALWDRKIMIDMEKRVLYKTNLHTIAEGIKYETIHEKAAESRVAVKVINSEIIIRQGYAFEIHNELKFRLNVRHTNIVHTTEVFEVTVGMVKWPVITMELASHCLANEINKYPGCRLPEAKAKLYFAQVCSAIHFMHHKGWAHCKINPWTIMIGHPDRAFLVGLSHVSNNKEEKRRENIPAMRAPEMLTPYEVKFDPFKTDVWAIGYCLYIATAGRLFWKYTVEDIEALKKEVSDVPEMLSEIKQSGKYPEAPFDLIMSMMTLDPNQRPEMKRVCKNPWLKSSHTRSPFADPSRPTENLGEEITEKFGPFKKGNELLPKQMHAAGYRIDHVMGAGGYGAVYHGFKGKREIAVKILDVRKCGRTYRRKYLKREMEVLKNFKHPNLVEVVDLFEEHEIPNKVRESIEKTSIKRVFVGMEMCPQDLHRVITRSPGGRLSEPLAMKYIMDAAKGLKYMHDHNCGHRDLKPGNILVRADGTACVTDYTFVIPRISKIQEKLRIYGQGKHHGNDEVFYGPRSEDEPLGTYPYCAPQIIKLPPHDYDVYKSDVWSLGIVIYEALTGNLPLTKFDLVGVYFEIGCVPLRAHIGPYSDQAKKLLARMLVDDEAERINITEVMHDEWFTYASKPDQLTFTKYKAMFMPKTPQGYRPNPFAIYMRPPSTWTNEDKDLYWGECMQFVPKAMRGKADFRAFALADKPPPDGPVAGAVNWPTMVKRIPGVAPWQKPAPPPPPPPSPGPSVRRRESGTHTPLNPNSPSFVPMTPPFTPHGIVRPRFVTPGTPSRGMAPFQPGTPGYRGRLPYTPSTPGTPAFRAPSTPGTPGFRGPAPGSSGTPRFHHRGGYRGPRPKYQGARLFQGTPPRPKRDPSHDSKRGGHA